MEVNNCQLCFTIDYISIESSIAATFNFATYSEVVMRKIDPVSVALDSVEITFKDQYLGRSEMWRLKTSLVRSTTINPIKHTECFAFNGQTYSHLCALFFCILTDQYLCLPEQKNRILLVADTMPGV